jgi:diphosphomevalonate decarboxylase
MMNQFTKIVRAPSNIALIKYMGKIGASAHLPENASLSMTLDRLATWVEIESSPAPPARAPTVRLLPQAPRVRADRLRVPDLSEAGRAKVIRHVERVRASAREILPAFGLESAESGRDLVLRSANTFPEASGIASSASSFAAITLATAYACAREPEAFGRAFASRPELKRALARVSRQGSGSSCRSFEGPFVLWEGENAFSVPSALPPLRHFVILISESAKEVSSSEAHERVKTSPLWQGRVLRAESRLAALLRAVEQGELVSVARLAWQEAWEMHSLFHTSAEPFSYWQPGTMGALRWLAPFVREGGAPPIVTLDAGPNLHLIVPETQSPLWTERLHERFGTSAVLSDTQGTGATEAQ